MSWPDPVVLEGVHVRLLPLSAVHCVPLAMVVEDGELQRLWYTGVPPPELVVDLIAQRLEFQRLGQWLPFVVQDRATGRIVGATNYMNIDSTHRRVEIGGTFYARSVQRTAINTECKLLLLMHAFEQLSCIAVEFRTHRFNSQSRAAIERLGAQLDGMLRNHVRATNGTLRDTAVYSIIESEWPTVKAHLCWQIDKPR